jgi:adenosine deaminase
MKTTIQRVTRAASMTTLLFGLGTWTACGAGDDLDAVEYSESLADRRLDELLGDEARLLAFVRDMPKGADLHSHTSGAITTEKLLRWGAEDGACIHPTTLVASNPCAPETIPLASAPPGSDLYQRALGAWSMEGFTGPLLAAHQHFFDAFGKYGAVQIDSRNDDSYADVMAKAGRDHQLYVELLQGFGSGAGAAIANRVFQATDVWNKETLLARRQQIIADPAFAPAVAAQAASIAATFAGARTLLGCDTSSPDPGCAVEVRLQVAANRTGSRISVFGQWVYAYELAQAVPELVGVNLVSPEENANSLRYYDDEMFALGVLDELNDSAVGRRQLHVSLHAGELIPEVVPDPIDLTFHIRRAVEVGRAERIGHGVDVLGETAGDGADDLLRDMREAGVMVEICLTSNRVLLGAQGDLHPLGRYLQDRVPVALATDDQGILRTSVVDEYLAAVVDQGLTYRQLKQLTRTGLEHAFVEGASLWRERDDFRKPVEACRRGRLGAATPSAGCAAYLAAHKRAALQWRLEGELAAFEDSIIRN